MNPNPYEAPQYVSRDAIAPSRVLGLKPLDWFVILDGSALLGFAICWADLQRIEQDLFLSSVAYRGFERSMLLVGVGLALTAFVFAFARVVWETPAWKRKP